MPTGIEWTDETWNPVTGCAKVSQGCKHCYAEREWPRMVKLVPSYAGRAFTDVACHEERLDQPLRWKRPRKVFVNSMSDLFHPDVSDEFIDRVFAVMALAPQHVFQVLTKRPGRMREYLTRPAVEVRIGLEAMAMCMASIAATKGKSKLGAGILLKGSDINPGGLATWPLPNVWFGVSVEDQAAADERIPLLLETPAAVRWISAEPLLGPVDLESVLWPNKGGHRVDVLRAGYWNAAGYRYGGPSAELGAERGLFTNHSDMVRLDWVVVGGESGPNARPMHPTWARSLRDQCAAAGVPYLFKQWGEFVSGSDAPCDLNFCYNNSTVGGWVNHEGGYSLGETARPTATDAAHVFRIGKKAAGRLLDGMLHDEYPETTDGTDLGG